MEDIFTYKRQDEEDYYNILGCDETSTCEQISVEYKKRALECHPDKHPDDPNSVECFARLQRAKGVLCDSKLRGDYDKWRRSGLAISYQDWCSKRDSIHTSMHWAVKKKKEPMLECSSTQWPDSLTETSSGTVRDGLVGSRACTHSATETNWIHMQWTRDPVNDVLSKFRNYEI